MGSAERKGYFPFCSATLEVGVVLRWGKVVGQKVLFTSEMMRGYGTYFQHCRCVSNFCVAQLSSLEFSGGGCHQKVKSTVGHP